MAAAAVTNPYSDYAFTETLDTSGNTTSWVTCQNWKNHTLAFTIPDAPTTLVVRAEGSLDGTNFFGLDPSGNADASGNLTYADSGTYALVFRNTPLNYIRLALISFTGAGAPSVTTVKYRGG
jgi:hypothetical protein